MRLIDADKLIKKKQYLFKTESGAFPKSEWFIKADEIFNAPTIERPHGECGTCKHYKLGGNCYDRMVCYHPSIDLDDPYVGAWLYMAEDDYCSDYERREGKKK